MQIYGEDSYRNDKISEKHINTNNNLSTGSCLVLFFTGFIGIHVIAILVELILALTPLWDTTLSANTWTNFITYAIMAPLMILLLYLFDKAGFMGRLAPFKNGRTYLHSFLFLLLLLSATYVYAIFESLIENAISFTAEPNTNQSLINKEVASYPVILVIETVIFAPIVEEITYRQGLFESIVKKSRVWAYVAVIIIFASIHTDFITPFYTKAGGFAFNQNSFLTEMFAFPTYAIAGGILAYCYEKENSVASSILMHAMSNLLSMIFILISVFAS